MQLALGDGYLTAGASYEWDIGREDMALHGETRRMVEARTRHCAAVLEPDYVCAPRALEVNGDEAHQ